MPLRLATASFLAWLSSPALADSGRWAAFSQPGWAPAADDTDAVQEGGSPLREPPLVVVLALKQRNVGFLGERAKRVSDPEDPIYGQHYTRDEVNSIAGPTDEHVAIVREFLEQAPEGRIKFSRGRDMARFVCSVSCVEKLFKTKLIPQQGPTTPGNSFIKAATPIQLPEKVSEVLDGVSLNAPIFMPKRPVAEKSLPFTYPVGDRVAPRINPNVIAGDQFLSLRFVAFCKDGSANLDSLEQGLCSSVGMPIVSFEIVILQEPSMQKVIQLPATRDVMGQKVGDCGSSAAGCLELNATVGNLQNYANTTARIRAHFADGSVSLFSETSELPPKWPLPYTTPALLSKFYGIPLNKPIRSPKNIISVAEFLGQYYNPVDLEAFFRLMGVRSWDGEGRTQPQIIGPDKPQAGSVFGGEAQLDLQYIMAMAANVTTWFWSVPGIELGTTQEPFLDWLMQVADSEDSTTPLVHSVSYADDEKPMPLWFKQRVNEEFMKLALRGISVLVASGDDGASGVGSRTDPSQCNNAMPMFPASSPWVTAVGGTQMAKAATPVCGYTSDSVTVSCHDEGEVVCTTAKGGGITSGGGFSSDFERPWYQASAVEGYLKQTDSPVPPADGAWRYNTTGRGYPDISAAASNYLVWMGDHLEPTSGTSASTPLVAAMVAHLNEERLQRNLPPLGFLNPLIYRLAERHPEAFNDVVIGDNRCNAVHCCKIGYGAARGWDAVTGFGSPNFGVMMDLIRQSAIEQAATTRTLFSGLAAGPRSPDSWTLSSSSACFSLLACASLLGASALGFFAATWRRQLRERSRREDPLSTPFRSAPWSSAW